MAPTLGPSRQQTGIVPPITDRFFTDAGRPLHYQSGITGNSSGNARYPAFRSSGQSVKAIAHGR